MTRAPGRMALIPVALALLLAPAACGGDGDGDGGGAPDGGATRTATAMATESPAATGSSAATAGPGTVSAGANRVCQDALDAYHRAKPTNDPVADQIVANQAVGKAAAGLAALNAASLAPLTDALREYATVGGQLAAAMDRGDMDARKQFYEQLIAIGARVKQQAQALNADACAGLAEI